MNIVTLETERLILRPFNENDLDAFFRIYSDKKVNQFLPWYPVQTKEEAKQFYEKRYAHSKDYRYAICLKEDNIPIGYVNVSMNESHDFGYGLLEAYWRQGIVSEACRAVLAQLKKEGLRYITATHDVRNPHSGYVMKSIGMSYNILMKNNGSLKISWFNLECISTILMKGITLSIKNTGRCMRIISLKKMYNDIIQKGCI